MADASHELKTPLTVIMTNAELLNSPDFDEARRSQFAAHILTMSRQMRRLIEEMLELAGRTTVVLFPALRRWTSAALSATLCCPLSQYFLKRA